MQPETAENIAIAVNDFSENKELTPQERKLANLRPFGPGPDPRRNLTGRPKKLPLTEALERRLTRKRANRIADALIGKAELASLEHFGAIADRLEGPLIKQATEQSKTQIQVVVISGDA